MREKLPGPSQSIAFTSDGQFGLSEVAGTQIIVWDLKRGQRARSLEHGLAKDGVCGSVAASDDGRLIAALGTNWAVDNGDLSFFELFDTETFSKLPVNHFRGHKYGRSVSFSPDSKWLALETFERSALGSILFGGPGKSRLTIYNVESMGWSDIAVPAALTCSAFSPDGKRVVTGSIKPPMYVWDVAKRAVSRQIPVPDGGVDEVAFSHDGSHIFAASFANDSLSIYTSSGECEKTISTSAENPEKMTCTP